MGEMSYTHAELSEAFDEWELEKMINKMTISELLKLAKLLEKEVEKREKDEDPTK